MLPEALQNQPDGIVFETREEGGKPVVVIHVGPVAARCFRGMRHAVAAMAGEGNNLIVDDVVWDGEMTEYLALLTAFEVYRVGVFAPLEVLEARESQRADRLPGLARWQNERVHKGISYDLEIDSNSATPLECARRIQEKFQL